MKKLYLIIGAPGSGKTTDASMIASNNPNKIAHFSTGELLRNEVKSGSSLGQIISEQINKGELVPVKIAVETIIKAIENCDKSNILIDGFPRSVEQMMELEKELANHKDIKLEKVIEVQVSFKTAKNRVLGRARGYDDKEEIFINRMRVYEEPLEQIRDFFESKKLLVTISGESEVENVVKEMQRQING